VEAFAYWSLASVSSEEAVKGARSLEQKMSSDQINAGVMRMKELLLEQTEAMIATEKADTDKKAGK
jgi:hypothetical protein